jgi:hypothetical protein
MDRHDVGVIDDFLHAQSVEASNIVASTVNSQTNISSTINVTTLNVTGTANVPNVGLAVSLTGNSQNPNNVPLCGYEYTTSACGFLCMCDD